MDGRKIYDLRRCDDLIMAVELTLPSISAQSMTLQSVEPITLVLGSVLNIAPTITTNPTISGTAKVGKTLTATAGDTTGTPPPTSTLQWQRSDNGTSGWSDISGATGTTYILVSADETKYLRVEQTATNIEGSVTATSASTSQVASAFSFLLDDYGGAAAAYSLRLLREEYQGSAIQVRRASDNQETSIGFVDNDLDIETLEEFASGTKAFVTIWRDQSGNGNDIEISSASQQPQIVDGGSTITDGGKASMAIDETYSRGLEIPITASSRQDFFQVHKTNDTGFIIFKDSASTSRFVWANQDGSTSTTFYLNYGTPSLFVNGTSQNPENRDALHSLLSTNNQVLVSSIGGDSSEFTGNIKWGYYSSAFIYDGNLQEIIFYNSDQSSNRTGIETNINDHYSIY